MRKIFDLERVVLLFQTAFAIIIGTAFSPIYGLIFLIIGILFIYFITFKIITMKKQILTTATLLTLFFTASAQTKKPVTPPAISKSEIPVKTMVLPPILIIKLSDKEFLRLDSAVKAVPPILDSKAQTTWFIKSFEPIYGVVEKQLVPDTVKKP